MKVLSSIVLLFFLSGCSAITDSLRPMPPEIAFKSFRDTLKNKTSLDSVKKELNDLFTETAQLEKSKSKQSWVGSEITLTGGVAATVGQVASKTGLLNTGLVLALLGLTSDQFYSPKETLRTHLAADQMFICMLEHLDPLSEDLRLQVKNTGNKEAATAVDDSISKINQALYLYRKKLLTQEPQVSSRDDFNNFIDRYSQKKAEADAKSVSALQKIASIKTANGVLEISAQKKAISDAELELATAKFIALSTGLEKCVKGFSQ